MGRKKRRERESEPRIREETRHAIWAVISLAVFVFLILAWWGAAGAVGRLAYRSLDTVFGVGFFVFPALALLLGISFFQASRPHLVATRFIGGGLFLVSSLGLATLAFGSEEGGWVGNLIASPIIKLFDYYAGGIILGATLVISLLVMFEARLSLELSLFGWGRKKEEDEDTRVTLESDSRVTLKGEDGESPSEEKETIQPKVTPEDKGNPSASSPFDFAKKLAGNGAGGTFNPPPLTLLERDSGKPGVGDIKANANIIKRTLANFGIMVEMDEVSIGPSITRYALKPAEGVKLSRIVGLQNDLALALAAHPIRIEAPIPGRSLVGIEIPNQTKSRVGLASLLTTPDFAESPHPLLVSLGRGISGLPHFANLAKAPHLLVAGATGSGKSVVIHTFITSLLYRNPPEAVRFIMIDPKRVELTMYNRIPHLLTPVITQAKKAILILKWAIGEMERRYGILEDRRVRDLQSYHQNILEPALKKRLAAEDMPERLPYLVIIIDELADIMSAYPRELEAAIVRLAQMSRAVGIHLILSTQRPSVEVITGLIKANIPSRIALQVASQIDSRTIIDMAGAEKLLGAGDLLYLSGEMAKPLRLQSAFISENEVKKVVEHLARQGAPEDELSLTDAGAGSNLAAELESIEQNGGNDDDDELYREAHELVVESGKASASLLQRRLKVGYARAARLLDMLEERGVIGPGEGAKPREVYAKGPESDIM